MTKCQAESGSGTTTGREQQGVSGDEAGAGHAGEDGQHSFGVGLGFVQEASPVKTQRRDPMPLSHTCTDGVTRSGGHLWLHQ